MADDVLMGVVYDKTGFVAGGFAWGGFARNLCSIPGRGWGPLAFCGCLLHPSSGLGAAGHLLG